MPIMDNEGLNVGLFDNSYPPRYEDALKLPAATPHDLEAAEVTTHSSTVQRNLSGPPPFYEDNNERLEIERNENHCEFLFKYHFK